MITRPDVRTSELAALAEALAEAERSRVPVAPPTQTLPGLAVDDAYAIQEINIARRLASGERAAGHKVGLTSLAMQQQLGVDQPDYGIITDAMVIEDDGRIDVDLLIAPRVEAEFAFRIGTDLPASPSLAELVDAIDGVAIALELIDSRVADWKITLADTIADNASSARIVCGAFVPASPSLLASLPATVLTLRRDQDVVGEGPGSAVLGDPLVSLHWLASAIGEHGNRFRVGDIVLAGAVAAAVPLARGAVWTATAEGLPTVHLTSVFTEPVQTEGAQL